MEHQETLPGIDLLTAEAIEKRVRAMGQEALFTLDLLEGEE